MGFHKSHGCKKITSAFFFAAKSRFQWGNDEFGGILRFATFSVLTDASFGENEISTYVRFSGLGGAREERKKLTPKLFFKKKSRKDQKKKKSLAPAAPRHFIFFGACGASFFFFFFFFFVKGK